MNILLNNFQLKSKYFIFQNKFAQKCTFDLDNTNEDHHRIKHIRISLKAKFKQRMLIFWIKFGQKRLKKTLFIDNNPSITKFLTCYNIQSLKTNTKSLVDDGQLFEYFSTTFPVGRRDNNSPVIQYYLINNTP